MRLLHTSDWHLGRVLYNHSRRLDHERGARRDRRDRARGPARPDHPLRRSVRRRPPAVRRDDARRSTRCASSPRSRPTVVVCGNHDSPVLFRIFQKLLGADARLRFVDRARLPEEGGILDFPVGDQRLRLAPLPFVHQNRLVEAFEDPALRTVAYADRIGAIEGVLRDGLLDGYDRRATCCSSPRTSTSTARRFSGSERELHVSDTYATRVEHLPAVSYAAFGHIHRPQSLPGSVPGTLRRLADPARLRRARRAQGGGAGGASNRGSPRASSRSSSRKGVACDGSPARSTSW